jgi:hypothetical protein
MNAHRFRRPPVRSKGFERIRATSCPDHPILMRLFNWNYSSLSSRPAQLPKTYAVGEPRQKRPYRYFCKAGGTHHVVTSKQGSGAKTFTF